MTIDLVIVLDIKCPFRMLEMTFQSIKISKLSGQAGPHPLAAHAPLRHLSMIEKHPDFTYSKGWTVCYLHG